MSRIKFQGESLETFFLYEVIQHDLSADLGVIGPLGPARSVTVKYFSAIDTKINKFYDS